MVSRLNSQFLFKNSKGALLILQNYVDIFGGRPISDTTVLTKIISKLWLLTKLGHFQ
jgi:hypothetical protein